MVMLKKRNPRVLKAGDYETFRFDSEEEGERTGLSKGQKRRAQKKQDVKNKKIFIQHEQQKLKPKKQPKKKIDTFEIANELARLQTEQAELEKKKLAKISRAGRSAMQV